MVDGSEGTSRKALPRRLSAPLVVTIGVAAPACTQEESIFNPPFDETDTSAPSDDTSLPPGDSEGDGTSGTDTTGETSTGGSGDTTESGATTTTQTTDSTSASDSTGSGGSDSTGGSSGTAA